MLSGKYGVNKNVNCNHAQLQTRSIATTQPRSIATKIYGQKLSFLPIISPDLTPFLQDDITKVGICTTFVFKMCSRRCKVTAHLYHPGRPLPLLLSFLFFHSHSSHVLQLSLLSVCVRRKDSLSHKGELLLSTSNLDTHPLLFLADSHRPCHKSVHYCSDCCRLLGSRNKCENCVYRIDCALLG